ncbi:MAG TPA: MauE/DoxX family redox-associated membrane protein [Parafilimonas sp.]|nr:MauE/DoxX family redox-associated membrane protein [Parafilimonas sp.]
MKPGFFLQAIQFLLILLLAYAAFSKLADHTVFKSQFIYFPVIGAYSTFFSWFIPSVELIIVILLFIPKYRVAGFYSAAILLAAFSLFLTGMLAFSEKHPCPCGGLLSRLSWPQHLLLNLLFLVLALAAIHFSKTNEKSCSSHKDIVATSRSNRKPV